MPRAAVVVPFDLYVQASIPGLNNRVHRLVRLQQQRGADVDLLEWVRFPSGLPEREARGGVRVRRFKRAVPAGGVLARAGFLRSLTHTLRDAVVEAKPDGIALVDEELMLACVRAKKALGVPLFYDAGEHWTGLVGEERPLEARLYALQQRLLARHLDHVYAAVEAVAERFRKLGCAATVIYNSKNRDEIHPYEVPRDRAKERLGLPPDSLVLGFIGSIHPGQGLDPALEALAGTPLDVHMLVLGGPAEERDKLAAKARALGCAERLHLRPGVPEYKDVVPVTCAFDVGMLTLSGAGPNYDDRLSTKLFDYMGVGLPTIATAYPELRRFAVDKVGFALPAKRADPASIREAVLKLRADEKLRAAMGARAREAFDREYCGERQDERMRASHEFWR